MPSEALALDDALTNAAGSPTPQQTEDYFGLLSLDSLQLALPLSSLREVVRAPEVLAPLPVTSPLVVGAIDVRGVIIPVIDLSTEFGLARRDVGGRAIVLISDDTRMVGVVVDAVRGVTKVTPDALQPMSANGASLLVTRTFEQRNGDITSVLETGKVLELPGVPTARAVSPEVEIEERRGDTGVAKRKLTLLQCGSHILAMDVTDVHTTLPGHLTRSSLLARGSCRGVATFRGTEVAVVDPLLVLGFEGLGEDNDANIVIELAEGFVILAITRLVQIVDVAEGDVMPVAASAVVNPKLITGVVNTTAGVAFVVDVAELRRDENLQSLAKLNNPIAGEQSIRRTDDGDESAVAKGPSYLTYYSGIRLASPLEQVDEIIPVPASFTATGVGGAILGVFYHREAVLPLVCLRTLFGMEPGDLRTSCLLVVSHEGRRTAVMIDRLHKVDALAWRDPESINRSKVPALANSDTIQVGDDTDLTPELDLFRLLSDLGV